MRPQHARAAGAPPWRKRLFQLEIPVAYGLAEDRSVVAEGLRALPPRERVILHLRLEKGLLQSEIAARVGAFRGG